MRKILTFAALALAFLAVNAYSQNQSYSSQTFTAVTATTGTFTTLNATSALPTRLKPSDIGSCTMTAGTCSAQSLASTYSVAPTCFAIAVSGTLTGYLKASSSTSQVTPSSSVGTDTPVVNWICFGN